MAHRPRQHPAGHRSPRAHPHVSRDGVWSGVASLAAGLGLAVALPSAWAHAAGAAEGSLPWTFEPAVVAALLLSAAGYGIGLWRLWRAAGVGRGVAWSRVAAFTAGWAALALALLSPLDARGLQRFSAHMVQHELMMVVAAPLLCIARPLVLWTWALPMAWRRRAGRFTRHGAWAAVWSTLTSAPVAWALHAVALWGWHAPSLFDAALHDEGLHTLQHCSFLGTALLFWWAVLKPGARAEQGKALLYLFTTMLHMGALGALLTLSSAVWYPGYAAAAGAAGVDALQDQQLGGLVMWVPASLAYLVAALVLAARWLGGSDASAAPPGRAAAVISRGGSRRTRTSRRWSAAPRRRH